VADRPIQKPVIQRVTSRRGRLRFFNFFQDTHRDDILAYIMSK
jgi:hypothetical protein